MKSHYSLILNISLALVWFTAPAWAQPKGPSIGKKTPNAPTGPSIGKSAAEGSNTKAEQGRVFNIPKVKVVQVAPNKGYLALFTVPKARVVIAPLSGENESGKPLSPGKADQDGLVVFPGLTPGNYRLVVTCEDYEPLDDIVNIEKGRQTARLAPLASKFATLRIGLGKQASKDSAVKLNGQPFTDLKIEAGQLVLEHVPVGKQTFSVSKSGFSEWTLEFDIRPGNNFVSATMEEETISVTIKTQPGAEVYVDNDPKRETPETGEMQIGLPLGEHNVRVTLPGFEPAGKTLNLAKEPRLLTVPIPLIPIADDAAFDEPFDPGQKTWIPYPPTGWQVQTRRGMTITGDAVAFVFNTTLPNRRFNIYRDFDLLMNLRLTKGKGVAWIVRAEDEKNYYLFELDRERKQLLFYISQNGTRRLIRQDNAVVNLDDTKGFYRITLEVRGNQFSHQIETPDGAKPLGGTFEDGTFRLGGVGLRAFSGAEVFINQFSILKPKHNLQGAAR
jgi:hypothetical protein